MHVCGVFICPLARLTMCRGDDFANHAFGVYILDTSPFNNDRSSHTIDV